MPMAEPLQSESTKSLAVAALYISLSLSLPLVLSSLNPRDDGSCGAHSGSKQIFLEAARDLARALHTEGWTLVYGAGTVGMMGEIASTLVSLSGPQAVHGIIPKELMAVERVRSPQLADRDKRDQLYGSLTVVKDMHTRKKMMAESADAFVALPGGFGTLEEVMEIITWNFLGIHNKPIVLFNVEGYYDEIFQWVRKAIANGFVDAGNANIAVEAKSPNEVIAAIKGYTVAKSRHALNWEPTK